jgi:hypothetical protein
LRAHQHFTDIAKADLCCRHLLKTALGAGLSERVLELATKKIRQDRVPEWREAYNLRVKGSTFHRATTIKDDIYDKAAPVPDMAPSPDRNQFLHEVIELVDQTAKDLEIKLR